MPSTQEHLTAINTLNTESADPVVTAFQMRATRDYEVIKVLEQISQIPEVDREKYLARVLSEAKTMVKTHEADLKKIQEYRAATPPNSAGIDELFKNNKDLIKARAFLIIGAGLTRGVPESEDAKVFGAFLGADGKDSDGSANGLIASLAEVAGKAAAATDPKEGLNILHSQSVEVATKSIEAIHTYLMTRQAAIAAKAKADEESANAAAGSTPEGGTDGGGTGAPAADTDEAAEPDPEAMSYLELENVLFAEAFGLRLNEHGGVEEIVDTEKAATIMDVNKSWGGFEVGDVIIDMWEVREKYTANAHSASSQTSAEYARILAETKGMSQIGLKVNRQGLQEPVYLFVTPGELASLKAPS